MKETTELDKWLEAGRDTTITVDDLDTVMAEWREAEDEYHAQKKISDEKYKLAAEAEKRALELMQRAGKTKYVVEGLGTCYQINKNSVTTPKTIEAKKLFFKYLHETHGEIFYWDKVSINSQTLNKLYNDEFEEASSQGNAEFSMPGIDAPTAVISLGFRKA
jgi:hypothetical protein